MRNKEFLKGIEIISSNMPEDSRDDWGIHAEHDRIWFGSEEWVTDSLDIKRLEELGWFIDDESWSCFT